MRALHTNLTVQTDHTTPNVKSHHTKCQIILLMVWLSPHPFLYLQTMLSFAEAVTFLGSGLHQVDSQLLRICRLAIPIFG